MNNVASKLRKLMNPQTVEDYGLSVSRAELMAVPEYAEAIIEFERSSDKSARMLKDFLRNAENMRAALVLRSLMGGSPCTLSDLNDSFK